MGGGGDWAWGEHHNPPSQWREPWKLGVTYTIDWAFCGTPSNETLVKIVLFKGGTAAANKIGNIVQNIPIGPLHQIPTVSGTYAWKAGSYEGGTAHAGR